MTGRPPPWPTIRIETVWERDCPVLRHAYDLQTLACAGIHPRDADRHIDYWQAYDARAELRATRHARQQAIHDRLLADIAAFWDQHGRPATPTADTQPAARDAVRPRAPRQRPPRIPHRRHAA